MHRLLIQLASASEKGIWLFLSCLGWLLKVKSQITWRTSPQGKIVSFSTTSNVPLNRHSIADVLSILLTLNKQAHHGMLVFLRYLLSICCSFSACWWTNISNCDFLLFIASNQDASIQSGGILYLMAYMLKKYLQSQYPGHCLLLSFTWPKFFCVLFHKCIIYNCPLHGSGLCYCHILASCSFLPCSAYPSSVVSEREQGSGILPVVHILGTGTNLRKQRKGKKNRKIFFFLTPRNSSIIVQLLDQMQRGIFENAFGDTRQNGAILFG